jgi:hypothetical protein
MPIYLKINEKCVIFLQVIVTRPVRSGRSVSYFEMRFTNYIHIEARVIGIKAGDASRKTSTRDMPLLNLQGGIIFFTAEITLDHLTWANP